MDLAHAVLEDDFCVVASRVPVEIDSVENLDDWSLFVILDCETSGNSLVKGPAVYLLDFLRVLADLTFYCWLKLVLSEVYLVFYLLFFYIF